jgi:methyl-galactoside transport system ATP-binding protein
MSEYLLEMNNISKEFPGVKALEDVTIKLNAGKVLSLMGENGAGKSTLMKCLFGVYHLDSGEVVLNGEKVVFHDVKQALNGGVAMVQQELNQVLTRSVMENLFLGRFPTHFGFVIDHKKMYSETIRIFESIGITNIKPKTILSNLSVSDRQMIEIAKAVSVNAKVIVFDEPTSSLADQEIANLFKIIATLKERGIGIIYISHKMDEIFKISDDIAVLRDGKVVLVDSAKNLDMAKIVKAMVGRDLTQRFPPKDNVVGNELFKCVSLSSVNDPTLKDISLDLREGEILGVAGLVGSGRTELVELLFGVKQPKKDEELYLRGKRIFNLTPSTAMANGFALVTEERRATGIFSILSVYENTVVANLKAYSTGFYVKKGSSLKDAKIMSSKLRVKTPSLNTKIHSLSGGNQQKVILARWLLTKPHVLLLDEPTRGIDVGAKYEIYQIMLDLAKEGRGIIMVSSEMPELLGVTDRILVMSNHKIAGIVDTKQTNQEEIMHLAAKYL